MNDEDFARRAFAAAFRSGPTGEPPTLPDVELLALHGRRANRTRRGAYAAGTTALAGVVVAGVVTGPTLLGLGTPSPSGISTAAGGSAAGTPPASPVPSKSPSQSPDPAKPSGVPCANPPTIDWVAVVGAALPAGIHAVADHAVNCLEFPEGSRSVEAGFILSVPGGILQVDVESGGALATKLGQTSRPLESKSAPPAASGSGLADPRMLESASPSLDPSTLASLQALKQSIAADSSASASLDAAKQSMAARDDAAARAAKESAAAAAATDLANPGSKEAQQPAPVCHSVAANINVCASTITKGGDVGINVQLIRSGADPVVINVVAAAGTGTPSPAPGTKAPLTEVQVTAIAEAVVAHF
jgi:hypothetical protein